MARRPERLEHEAGRAEHRGRTSGAGNTPVLAGAGWAADLAWLMASGRFGPRLCENSDGADLRESVQNLACRRMGLLSCDDPLVARPTTPIEILCG